MVPNVSNNLCTLVPNIDKNYLPLVVVTKFLMKRRNHHGHNIYQTVQWNQKTSLKILWLVFEPSNLCMSLGCFCQEGGGRRRRRTLLAYVSSATKAYQWHRTYVITKTPAQRGQILWEVVFESKIFNYTSNSNVKHFVSAFEGQLNCVLPSLCSPFFCNYLVMSKQSGRFFQIFVAFSEYLTFIWWYSCR